MGGIDYAHVPRLPPPAAASFHLWAEKEKREAELQARLAEKREPKSYLHPHAEVPKEERKRMLWMPDKERGEAWLALHDLTKRRSGGR